MSANLLSRGFLKQKPVLILCVILILAVFLRFYRLPEMAPFDFDQEYAANFAYSVLKDYPIQLIGQGLSVQGLFMGPWYFYYLTPFFAVTHLHPIGGVTGSAILGILTVLVYYFAVSRVFGQTAGLLAAFFRAVLFSFVLNDLAMAPSFASDILIVLTWYCFYNYWHGNNKALLPLGLIFGLYTSIHPILFPFYLVFIILILLKRQLPDIRNALLGLGLCLASIAPLLLFEVRHNFLEIKRLFALQTQTTGINYWGTERFFQHIQTNISETRRIFELNFIPKEWLVIFILGTATLLIIKKIGFWKDSFHPIILIVTYPIFLIYYTFLPTRTPEYYFLVLTIMVIIYTSALLSLLEKKFLTKITLVIILGVIVYNNLNLYLNRWNNPNLVNLHNKDVIVREILKRQPKEEEFFVSYIKLPGWNFGFDYLFKIYGQIPQTKEAKPPVYTIVIPKYLSPGSLDQTSGNVGLILPE